MVLRHEVHAFLAELPSATLEEKKELEEACRARKEDLIKVAASPTTSALTYTPAPPAHIGQGAFARATARASERV